MKKKPLISVIITYYKKKLFIKRTLTSILNQKYKNYEIVFVYDEEDKADIELIKKLLKKFKKKKLIINNKNLGVAKSRNKAIKKSKGKYLAFIDSDDLWKKNKLFNQLNFMEKNFYNFSYTSYAVINEKGKIIKERKIFSDANYYSLYKSNFIGLNTVMINKKISSKINFPNLTTQEDFALWLKLLRQGVKLKCLNQTLSFWRKTRNSLSSNIIRKLIDAFKLYYFYEKKNFIIAVYSVLVLSYNKIIKFFN
jgi:teichuronic acid biosynthesis glycosyltransferase TuaG